MASSGFAVSNNVDLIRTNIWQRELRQLLLDDLIAQRFVRILDNFPDGTTLNIPSLGEAEVSDFAEGQAIKYNRMDTGNFVFSFDRYKYSAHAITEKFKRDSYYSSDVIAAFVPREHRALMEAVEVDIFGKANAGQTPNALNTINSADHRFVGSGTAETITVTDFARAHYALTKANVPMRNLTAVVDPSVAYTLQTQTNLVNFLSPNPMWAPVVNETIVTGMKFRFNVFGFDVYVSNYLPRGIVETIGGLTTATGVANLFFAAVPGDVMPIIGGFRQMPTVYSKFNIDLQQSEYATITEFGFKLYRPENMVIVLTDTDQVV